MQVQCIWLLRLEPPAPFCCGSGVVSAAVGRASLPTTFVRILISLSSCREEERGTPNVRREMMKSTCRVVSDGGSRCGRMIKLPMKKKQLCSDDRQGWPAGGDGHSRTLLWAAGVTNSDGHADPAERRSSSNSNRIQELLQTTTVETD